LEYCGLPRNGQSQGNVYANRTYGWVFFYVKLEGRGVQVRAWKYDVKGVSGYTVAVYLLDCDLSENKEWDRKLTHYRYTPSR
jgi:hypothetical protein